MRAEADFFGKVNGEDGFRAIEGEPLEQFERIGDPEGFVETLAEGVQGLHSTNASDDGGGLSNKAFNVRRSNAEFPVAAKFLQPGPTMQRGTLVMAELMA